MHRYGSRPPRLEPRRCASRKRRRSGHTSRVRRQPPPRRQASPRRSATHRGLARPCRAKAGRREWRRRRARAAPDGPSKGLECLDPHHRWRESPQARTLGGGSPWRRDRAGTKRRAPRDGATGSRARERLRRQGRTERRRRSGRSVARTARPPPMRRRETESRPQARTRAAATRARPEARAAPGPPAPLAFRRSMNCPGPSPRCRHSVVGK